MRDGPTVLLNNNSRKFVVYKGHMKDGRYVFELVMVGDEEDKAVMWALREKQLDTIENIRLYQLRRPVTDYYVYKRNNDNKDLHFATSELQDVDLFMCGDHNSPLPPEVVFTRITGGLHVR